MESDENRRLKYQVHRFMHTVALMLLEAGIQVEIATSIPELLRKPGVMVWRQSMTIMISANLTGRSDFDTSRRRVKQLTICAMALRNTFDRVLGLDASTELFSFTNIGADDRPLMMVTLPLTAAAACVV